MSPKRKVNRDTSEVSKSSTAAVRRGPAKRKEGANGLPAGRSGSGSKAAHAAKAAGAERPRRASKARGHQEGKTGAATKTWVEIGLRTTEGEAARIESSPRLQEAALRWSYVMCNRRRWNTSEAGLEDQEQRAREDLFKLGIGSEQLARIAEAGVVEVLVPFVSEAVGWEARVFPWESLLTAATRKQRQGKRLAVVRHLERAGRSEPSPRRKPERVLMVESAPAGLRLKYDFDSERALVKSAFPSAKVELAEDLTRAQLRQKILSFAPDVIHLAGFDNNQAAALGVLSKQQMKQVHDGYLLRGEGEAVDSVNAGELALLLNAADRKPALIACNLYYSAARICSLAVAEGAAAAIGFQDELSDELAELFFTSFYSGWSRKDWDTIDSFKYACDVLRNQPQALSGSGVVLWSDRSMIRKRTAAAKKAENTLLKEKERVITLDKLPNRSANKLLSVEVKTCPSLNYSMLHNNCVLFEKFVIRKEELGQVKDIQIRVSLHVGGDSSHYVRSVDMVDSPLDLNKVIRVPLVYSIDLVNNENIHTGLFVEVTWEGQVLHRDTYRVTLPPLDEWRGNATERVFLPSFVLRRDPAVSKVVQTAQSYVMALRDDGNAGFDGYQAIDPNKENPVEGVDLQARAIWSVLTFNSNISYINPPPVDDLISQRLRTPSEVLDGRRGTCIDLALLVAACLEYVDIYPVIFLLKNHAFPGYWRSSAFQAEFTKVQAKSPSKPISPTGEEGGSISTVQEWPWYISMNAYDEIMAEIDADRLWPLETVGITQRAGFESSVNAAVAKLENKAKEEIFTFEGMIDIRQARDKLITPIPRR